MNSKKVSVALVLILLILLSTETYGVNVVNATSSYNPATLNFSKINTFLPNLGDGFPVFNDSFSTDAIANYTSFGDGSLSISGGAARLSSSITVMASASPPYAVPNMCVKATIANFSSSTGTFGLMVYADESDYIAAVYDKSTSQWSLEEQTTTSGLTIIATNNCPPIQFPCTFALLLQGENAMVFYSTDNQKTWLVACQDPVEGGLAWDMRLSVENTQWRGGMLSTAPEIYLSNFCCYYSVGFCFRDPKPIIYSTGQPYVYQNCIYFTATLGGNDIPQSRTGVLSWNLTSNKLTILSFIYYNRTSSSGYLGIYGDHAGQIFYDAASNQWFNYVCSWGSGDLDGAAVSIWYGKLSFNPTLTKGVQVANGFIPVDLSNVTPYSTYDPCVFKIGSEWYMYFINANGLMGWSAHCPHLVQSSNQVSWSNVYENFQDSSQGAGMFLMGTTPYLCASNGSYYNATTGLYLGHFNYWMNGTTYTPWTMPVLVNGVYYMLTYTSDIQFDAIWGYGIGVMETFQSKPNQTLGSCDEKGTPQNSFNAGDTIYAYGTGFSPNATYTVYLVNDTDWIAGMTIPSPVAVTNVTTDSSGNFSEAAVYSNAAPDIYDMTIKNSSNNDGLYDSGDPLCLNIVTAPNPNTFFIESNSTISAITFNATSSEIAFTVSGPSGTTGYVKATISKKLMPNADNLRVYVDQNQIAYNLTSNEASWIITFTYHHSTHQVRIYYSANTTEAVPRSIVIATGIILGITFTAAVCLIVWLAKKSKNSDG